MWPDRISNPGLLALESDALETAPHGSCNKINCSFPLTQAPGKMIKTLSSPSHPPRKHNPCLEVNSGSLIIKQKRKQ